MEKKKIGIYGMVPIALLQDNRVKPNMMRVYCSLASFQGGDEKCYPSVQQIAERAGMKPYAVSAATDELEKIGWIRKKRRSNSRQTNIYEVLVNVEEEEKEQENNPDVGKTPTSEKSQKRAFLEKPLDPSYHKKNTKKNIGTSTNKKEKHPGTGRPMNRKTYDELVQDYGKSIIDDYFQKAADYCDSIGREKYKDHAATVRNWLKKDNVEKIKKQESKKCKHCGSTRIHPDNFCMQCGESQ